METRHILIVDDRKTHRQYIGDVLQSAGFTVTEVSNAEEARQKLAEGMRFDALMVDQMMPKETGTQFLRALRAESTFKTLPMVLITAYPEDDEVQKIEKENVRVLPKPVRDYHEIILVIEEVLQQKG
jgi:CheY-like chemotaxis protein